MDSVSLRHSISASPVLKPTTQNRQNSFTATTRSRFGLRTRRSLSLPIHSKQSHFQDFRDYAKPSRLFQAEEVKLCSENSEEIVVSYCSNDVSRSLYKVELGTSRFSGSSLSDANAGVLLCLIDKNGDSILQSIPASLDDESLRFQRGSLDEFTFVGPNLGRVEAMWIGPESGQWRLDKASLTVIRGCQQSAEEEEEEVKYIGARYEFQAEDIELGERSKTSMIELRPCLVTELSNLDPSTLLATSLENQQISNEQSMKEYANLKLSLLIYDAVLVLVGASLSRSLAFLVGGVGGFLYLILLQRSVDGLSAQESNPQNKGSIFGFALALGFALFAIKYGSEDFPAEFTAKDLVLGMMGFLVCKVSVVLTAMKPVTKGFED